MRTLRSPHRKTRTMPKDAKKKKVKGGMDAELEALLGQLSTLQVRVGGGSAGTTEASRAALARGGVGADPFLDLKEAMLAQLSDVRSKVREHQAKPAKTPRDQIAREAEVKKALRKLRHDWHDLDTMIQAELRRKKPRYEKDELQMREEVVLRLMREIDAARTMSKQARNEVKDIETGHSRTIVKKEDHELFQKRDDDVVKDEPREAISDSQQQRMQQLQERDRQFDDQISTIGRGVEELGVLASRQAEEVTKQGIMLEDLNERVENVQEHVATVNSKMKDTLDVVGRSSDKLCVDVMCLLFLIGLCIIAYQLLTKKN